MKNNRHVHEPNTSLEPLAELFKEQLRLLGRMLSALRKLRPLTKPQPRELTLDVVSSDAPLLSPRVAYERDEEVAATD